MTNSKIVVKIGGSNLKSISDLKRVVNVVKSYNKPIIIVVSAFYGITDQLLYLIKNRSSSNAEINDFLSDLRTKKLKVIEENIFNPILKNEVKEILHARLIKLKSLLNDVDSDNNNLFIDPILIYGELLSSLIISYLLKENKLKAEEVLPEQIGLITDGKNGNASVDLQKSRNNVNDSLSADMIFVIPGFYGISPEGRTTLLGRGGTDYAAASIANCINAESLDVWKDVDGFMSANPKFVNNAQKIETLTYSEAAELAYFGAQILHPGTIEPLQLKNIPLKIFNIESQQNAMFPKSIINGKSRIVSDRIKSVTYSEDFAILKLKGASVGIKPGILAKVAISLDQHNINIKSVITSQIAINLLLAKADVVKARELISNLKDPDINRIRVYNDIALIATVGEGITEKHGIAAKVFTTVANNGINVQMIAFGASQVSSYFIVDLKDKEKTIQVIHEAFFESCKKETLRIA